MKIAHLILAHTFPEQLYRLINKLTHPDADIYVYLDAKAGIEEFNTSAALKNVYFLANRIPVYWGNYSMVKATLLAFEEILATGKRNTTTSIF